MLEVHLPEDLDRRLTKIAEKTGRPKNYYVRKAIQAYLDKFEHVLESMVDYEE